MGIGLTLKFGVIVRVMFGIGLGLDVLRLGAGVRGGQMSYILAICVDASACLTIYINRLNQLAARV